LLGSIVPIALAQTKVMYKAHCGKMYSAADAKKYHYKCPMDHKPLVKMASTTHKKSASTGSMGGMKM